tara:strand:- start:72 stop:242 length:171 start_codon:yes stop_codon:yes gene_type:complete
MDFRMIQHLAELSGQSVSAMAGNCLSEYLQENYLRLAEFYEEARSRLDAQAAKPSK